MARICRGFGMKVIAYDVYQNESLKDFVTYVTLDELLAQSDLISLHCPLMDSTYHLINKDTALNRLIAFVFPPEAQVPVTLQYKIRLHEQLLNLLPTDMDLLRLKIWVYV